MHEAGLRLHDPAAGIANAEIVTGDGTEELSEHAPFDAIFLSAAFSEVRPPLVERLPLATASCGRSGGGGDEEVQP